MARESGDASFLDRADALIADVHATLGADRRGKPLGRPDAPLAGGLRIGKVQDEGHPDGDGQCVLDQRRMIAACRRADVCHRRCRYMHYLTKWMARLRCACMPRALC